MGLGIIKHNIHLSFYLITILKLKEKYNFDYHFILQISLLLFFLLQI